MGFAPHLRHSDQVSSYRVAEAAGYLGVSDDTLRRWIEAGRIEARSEHGRTVVDGGDLAVLALQLAETPERDVPRAGAVSARNRFEGLVTRVVSDPVMSQVELVCGPYRVVSLMSTEAVRDLGLQPGSRALASVKSTNVVVEVP